jgi:hypothetical protein
MAARTVCGDQSTRVLDAVGVWAVGLGCGAGGGSRVATDRAHTLGLQHDSELARVVAMAQLDDGTLVHDRQPAAQHKHVLARAPLRAQREVASATSHRAVSTYSSEVIGSGKSVQVRGS